MVEKLEIVMARRLALAKAGLLRSDWSGLPERAGRGERRQREAARMLVDRFGYLQLDTVSIAGARSHALVLMSRLDGFPPDLAEQLLRPGEPLFEYWGHEASWLPLEHYPLFGFRRSGIRRSPWFSRMINGQHRLAREVLCRIRDEGALRSVDLDGRSEGGWWAHKPAKRIAVALWSTGELTIRERVNFQRSFDLPERTIPKRLLDARAQRRDAIRELLRIALDGHGWATTGTLAATWRLRNMRREIQRALHELVEAGQVIACHMSLGESRSVAGWIQPPDLDLAERLRRLRPRKDQGVLLSPFDPVLWDRKRVALLFGFDQVLEIFKPAALRRYGYFCLPVLAGEKLVARVDLKAEKAQGSVQVLSKRYESTQSAAPRTSDEERALEVALSRHARSLGLEVRRPT